MFHFLRNQCSTSGIRVPLPGIDVPLPPKSVFHFFRNRRSSSSEISIHLRVGRRDPLQHPPGRRPAVHAGGARGAVGRHQGAGGHRGRLSGECGELVERAAGLAAAGTAGAGDGGRRRPRSASGRRCATSGRRRRRKRDWCHKMANVLDKLPKRLRPRAKRALREVMYAATRADAETAIGAFVDEFEAKYPKASGCLVEDQEALLAFFAMPAEHWLHLRTSNLIESPFATVRLRQRVTKGAGSRTKGLLMAFKLLEMAQRRWRRLNGAQLLPLGACRRPVRRWRARGTGPDGNGDSEGGCLNHVTGRSTTIDNSSRSSHPITEGALVGLATCPSCTPAWRDSALRRQYARRRQHQAARRPPGGETPCLAKIRLRYQRTVLSFRRVAAAISRRLHPVASITATEVSARVRPSAEATRAGSMWGGRPRVDQQQERGEALRCGGPARPRG